MLFRSRYLCLLIGLTFAAASAPAATLTYSNYLRDSFMPKAIAADPAGNVYLAGNVIADPVTRQTTVLVIKLNPLGNQYLYTRFLGGSVGENAFSIAVDKAGNAYIAGVTNSPDFPVTAGSNLGTPPVPPTERSFVTKLDPSGNIVFSTLLGGSLNTFAQAVAVNASGQVLVSGTSVDSGFPSTPGVFNVPDTKFAPYLVELDPTGTKVIFSATGIGGTALTFDSAGNIYMAGTTGSLTYPLTPGTFQPTFPMFLTCIAPCHGQFQGPNQYVTKLDSTGTKMIFSTAVSGTGNTMNEGLAVDAAGNVYLTGVAGVGYPFTVPVPTQPLGPALDILATPALPYLTKLDPAGQKLLYSVPIGGMGVQLDASGNAYVGGLLGRLSLYDIDAPPPALASIPSGCFLPEVTFGGSAAYAAQVDNNGNVLGTQFIGGSSLVLSGAALSGTTLFVTGSTNLPDFPFTPNVTTIAGLRPSTLPGAYLGAVNFSGSQPPAGTPQFGCIVDAADGQPTGPIVPYQLLTIFGNGIGPATPVAATDNTTTSLGGVSVTFGGLPAAMLYASSNQINLAVPLVQVGGFATTMQITVNGTALPPLAFPVTPANPRLFVVPGSFQPNFEQFVDLAINADGSVNSASNPAPLGSVISVFVNGFTPNPQLFQGPPNLLITAGWSVVSTTQATPYVLQMNLRIPATNRNFECPAPHTSACLASFSVDDIISLGALTNGPNVLSFGGLVYVAPQ